MNAPTAKKEKKTIPNLTATLSIFMQKLPIRHYHVSRLVLLLILIKTSLALTGPQLKNTFNFHYPANTEPGGCDQNAPNGKPMLPHVIASATDAFKMATKIQQTIDSYNADTPYADRMRRLLFLLFGISFGDDSQLDGHKEQQFNFVKGIRSRFVAEGENATDQLDRDIH